MRDAGINAELFLDSLVLVSEDRGAFAVARLEGTLHPSEEQLHYFAFELMAPCVVAG